MKTEISIAIITKNRKKELKDCLDSIVKQTLIPNVIIIDNDAKLSAQHIINHKKYKQIKIDYYHSPGSVPKCRNLAIKMAKDKYLGFVDDDCILDKEWTKNGLESIKKYKTAYVLGKTLLLNPNNIFALAQYSRDDYWKNYNLQIFDTKNVILDLGVIKQSQLRFDENCQKEFYDSADFDFDFALKKLKLSGKFCENMTLKHKETSNFTRFRRRAYCRGYLAKYLDRKWKLNNTLVDLRTRYLCFWLLKSIKNFSKDCQKYNQYEKTPLCKKILITFVIKLFERYYVIGYAANQATR